MRRKTAVLGLGGICAFLAAVLLYLLLAPLPTMQPPTIILPTKPRPVLDSQPATMPPAAFFTDLDARPAFNPSRKPFAVSQAAEGALTPPAVTVVGVIIDSEDRIAMIRVPSAPLAMAYRVGAAIMGWQVAEIEPDRVVLASGAMRDEIRLDANRATKGNETHDRP